VVTTRIWQYVSLEPAPKTALTDGGNIIEQEYNLHKKLARIRLFSVKSTNLHLAVLCQSFRHVFPRCCSRDIEHKAPQANRTGETCGLTFIIRVRPCGYAARGRRCEHVLALWDSLLCPSVVTSRSSTAPGTADELAIAAPRVGDGVSEGGRFGSGVPGGGTPSNAGEPPLENTSARVVCIDAELFLMSKPDASVDS
jgi:hypothetical protein